SRAFGLFTHRDQRLGLRIGQRLQQHSVDHREHHRRRADSQGESQKRDKQETRPSSQSPHRVANILKKIVQPSSASRVSAKFLHLFRTAQLEPRPASSFVGRKTLRDQIGLVLLQMKLKLSLKLFLHCSPAPQALPPVHFAPPSAVPSISRTASASLRQPAV